MFVLILFCFIYFVFFDDGLQMLEQSAGPRGWIIKILKKFWILNWHFIFCSTFTLEKNTNFQNLCCSFQGHDGCHHGHGGHSHSHGPRAAHLFGQLVKGGGGGGGGEQTLNLSQQPKKRITMDESGSWDIVTATQWVRAHCRGRTPRLPEEMGFDFSLDGILRFELIAECCD